MAAILDNISFKAELYGRLQACSSYLGQLQTMLGSTIAQIKSERDALRGLVVDQAGWDLADLDGSATTADADLVSLEEAQCAATTIQAITDACAPYDLALDSAAQSAATAVASVVKAPAQPTAGAQP
jgi:hypothetical protein